MVNKAVVGVIGVILITTLGVGALVGLQGGGGNADDTNANGNGGGGTGTPQANATATPNGTVGDSGNGTSVTATPAPDERTPIPARKFNKQDIERHIETELNEWRRSEGVQSLAHNGNTAERIASMSRNHSVSMANEGNVTHVIDGVDTTDRYKNEGLFDLCQFQSSDGYIAQPGRAGGRNIQFEHITSTVAGGQYETANGTQFNGDDEAVAEAIVREFKQRPNQTRGLLAPNAGRVGVGVEITRTGSVYATVHLCAR